MLNLLCAIPFAANLFAACEPPGPLATGYVEGEYTLLAPVAIAQIATVPVSRGDQVAAGEVLVVMEQRDTEIAIAKAEAALAGAKAHLAGLKEGERPEEIEVLEATLESATARLAEAERTQKRIADLVARGASTASQLENAETAARVAAAQVAQIKAQIALARLPARPQLIAQAEAAVRAADATLSQANWNHDQRTLTLDEPVTVVDIIRQTGEVAGPSAPVLSLLGENGVKLRLYVPETRIAEVHVGTKLHVSCDGCADDMDAKITYISDGPEFTPPVIYSLQNRQKLVYLIEAIPETGTTLKPGQIVDVTLSGSSS